MLVLKDSLSLPGDAAKPNEDAFAHAEAAALVMDGATPLGDPLMPGPSDAAWLAQFGSRRLMAHLKDGETADEALAAALAETEKSFAALARHPVRERWQIPCASLMLVQLPQARLPLGAKRLEGEVPVAGSAPFFGAPAPGARVASEGRRGSIEFAWFGDCGALVLRDGACDIIGEGFDRRAAEAQRARQIAKAQGLAPAPDLNRPQILAALRAQRNHVNTGGNWLFSPDPRAAAHVRRQRVEAAPGTLLLLASDGFLALATDYGAYDAAGLMAAAQEKGLAALGAELRAIEADDALGERFARFKKSDDATAILLEVAS